MKSTFATTLSLAGALALAASATPANAQCAIACGEASATSIVQVHNHGREAAPAKDIVSTAVAAEDFTVLASLLEKTGLVEVLQGDGPFTVFAPTDKAFEKVPAEVLEALAGDKDLLKSVLLYHVAPGTKKASEVVGMEKIEMVSEIHAGIKVTDEGAFIDGARITATDIAASNGVIHVIDSVILPPNAQRVVARLTADDIVGTAVAAGNFRTLANLLTEAGLVEVLQGDGPFTVFAPTDEAFAKVPEETVNALLADKDLLRSVLLYHVVSGEVLAEQVVGVDSVATVQGTSATVTNGYGKVKIDNATIIATDVIASNGVIHVIDSVIIPQG